ncbi:hypothetical protein [Actinotalea fermentans]|nr:hypothetical protein [Actinotalea fermentans]
MAGAAACANEVKPDCELAVIAEATLVDLAEVRPGPAREGCDFTVDARVGGEEGSLPAALALDSDGETLALLLPTEQDPLGEIQYASGIAVFDADGDVETILREPGSVAPSVTPWLGALTDDWVLWADSTSSELAALDSVIYSADRHTGEIRKLGETSRDPEGRSRTVAGYSRPTIVGDWAFWVDVPVGKDGSADRAQIVTAPLDGSSAPVVVAGRGFMATADDCSPVPALVFADPGVGEARILRVPVDAEGPGPVEVVAQIDLAADEFLEDVAACDQALGWAVTREEPAETDADDQGLAASPGTMKTTLWLTTEYGTTQFTSVAGQTLADVALNEHYLAFTQVEPGNAATHYLFRPADRALLTIPTELGAGQVFRLAGDKALWLQPQEGEAAEEAFVDLRRAEAIIATLTTPTS